ncbi:MAG: hypothetical protein JWM16_3401 [Verrucomicrobiales bacterium]|nr:hypothetical protein [Verrucomicrobiales bacterium]
MNQPKPKQTLEGQPCPCCEKGRFALVQIDHTEEIPDSKPLLLPGIWVEHCNQCGEILFPGETTRFIQARVAEEIEQLAPHQLEEIRERLGVERQDEMSEILGLGAKTYHKWENGSQFPTRSMCHYIRVLAEFPDAFQWLRQRAWRYNNRMAQVKLAEDFETIFPDLAACMHENHTFSRRTSTFDTRINPACGLMRVAFSSK